jgi:hypothetical protein
MKYLKQVIADGIFNYIPLDNAEFLFVEQDVDEYRVEVRTCGRTLTLSEKVCISSVDECMKRVLDIPDGEIVAGKDILWLNQLKLLKKTEGAQKFFMIIVQRIRGVSLMN